MNSLHQKRVIRILFVYATLSSFIKQDIRILRKHFSVKTMKTSTFLLPRLGRDFSVFFKLVKGIIGADVVVSWFANLNALFIVLLCIFLNKKAIIVVGGYEVAYIPKINYGALLSVVGLENFFTSFLSFLPGFFTTSLNFF